MTDKIVKRQGRHGLGQENLLRKDETPPQISKFLRKTAEVALYAGFGFSTILHAQQTPKIAVNNVAAVSTVAIMSDDPNVYTNNNRNPGTANTEVSYGIKNPGKVGELQTVNWTGYTGASNFQNPEPLISGISATWTVPEIKPSKGTTEMSTWIGIGGSTPNDHTLIQAGTMEKSTNGSVRYFAFVELLPEPQRIIPIKINKGEAVSFSIQLIDEKANRWAIQVTNVSTNESFIVKGTYNSSRLTANWIGQERNASDERLKPSSLGYTKDTIKMESCYVTIGNTSLPLGDMQYRKLLLEPRGSQTYILSELTGKAGFTVYYGIPEQQSFSPANYH
jgi:hypothetical protein